MAAFESSVVAGGERIILEQQLANIVGNMCSSVIIHEALRTRTSESLSSDASFLQVKKVSINFFEVKDFL